MRAALVGLPAAAAISSLGTGMTMLAIPWFVLESTGSGTRTGLVVGAETLGLLIGSAFGGPWLDRLRPHRAAVLFDLCGAAVALAIPLLHQAHALPLGVLGVLCLALGLSRSPGDSARTATRRARCWCRTSRTGTASPSSGSAPPTTHPRRAPARSAHRWAVW